MVIINNVIIMNVLFIILGHSKSITGLKVDLLAEMSAKMVRSGSGRRVRILFCLPLHTPVLYKK